MIYTPGDAKKEITLEIRTVIIDEDDTEDIAEELTKQMKEAARLLDFERAAYLRDFGRDPHLLFSEVLSRYPAYFVRSDSAVALTGKGMNVSNTLIAECLACLA